MTHPRSYEAQALLACLRAVPWPILRKCQLLTDTAKRAHSPGYVQAPLNSLLVLWKRRRSNNDAKSRCCRRCRSSLSLAAQSVLSVLDRSTLVRSDYAVSMSTSICCVTGTRFMFVTKAPQMAGLWASSVSCDVIFVDSVCLHYVSKSNSK